MNAKTSYEQWIEANTKLNKCYESYTAEVVGRLAPKDQLGLCSSEKEAVRKFLTSNKVAFANLV